MSYITLKWGFFLNHFVQKPGFFAQQKNHTAFKSGIFDSLYYAIHADLHGFGV